MHDTSDSIYLDNMFGALSHTKRRAIIHELALRPATVGQLAIKYDLSLPAIHKHIRTLEGASLIIRKKKGRTNFVALNHTTIRVLQEWTAQYHTTWGSNNATLDNYISRMQE